MRSAACALKAASEGLTADSDVALSAHAGFVARRVCSAQSTVKGLDIR